MSRGPEHVICAAKFTNGGGFHEWTLPSTLLDLGCVGRDRSPPVGSPETFVQDRSLDSAQGDNTEREQPRGPVHVDGNSNSLLSRSGRARHLRLGTRLLRRSVRRLSLLERRCMQVRRERSDLLRRLLLRLQWC